ncbi:MAG: M64 family metallopeptidase, partial [Planctomycetota bacterium]|nr:M64 family metallopeptidase [Planctomycetota bacterium]
VKGVGVYEGGATFTKGVWRPARSCAMNAAGNNQFCPVCREQTIRVIYEYVNPIDEAAPEPDTDVKAVQGDGTAIVVTPMQPLKHALEAAWYVKKLAVTTPSDGDGFGELPDDADDGSSDLDDDGELSQEELDELAELYEQRRGRGGNATPRRSSPWRGSRGRGSREEFEAPPAGKPSRLGKIVKDKRTRRFRFDVSKLPIGRYTVTVEVKDPTKWVLKDPRHLLKERMSWTVSVAPKPK